MQWDNPRLAFPRASQYAFLFENAHLLLLSFERDNSRFLFHINEHREDGLVLDYPGEMFISRVLDNIEQVFFVEVAEEGQSPAKYALGSYFVVDSTAYGAYYPLAGDSEELVLFRIVGENPNQELEVVDGAEYDRAAAAFSEQHADFVDIQGTNNAGN